MPPSSPVIEDYDPNWPHLFETLRASISDEVADIAVSIEHVGSTAVPGLAAKPVIDIDVVVNAADVAEGIARLTRLGYVHRGDLGIPLREAFRRPANSAAHHLYLCPVHSPALANHLVLRDHLRAHPDVALAYAQLKRRLAVAYAGDMAGYVEGKTDFIVSVLRQAGFAESNLSEIEAANRTLTRENAGRHAAERPATRR